jgi:hypothetical protein
VELLGTTLGEREPSPGLAPPHERDLLIVNMLPGLRVLLPGFAHRDRSLL